MNERIDSIDLHGYCNDPRCPVCADQPDPIFKLPVKLSPKPNVTHGWDGLDDDPTCGMGRADVLQVREIDE